MTTPPPTPGTPVQWVRKLRRRLGLSQAQLAELLDVDRTSIVLYEKGARSPCTTRTRILRATEKALNNKWVAEQIYPASELSVDQRLARIFHCAVTLPGAATP